MKWINLIIIPVFVSACSLDRSALGPAGVVGVGECADVTFSPEPRLEYLCAGESISYHWQTPRLPFECTLDVGRGCIIPPDGLDHNCVDTWTQPTDYTPPADAGDTCTEERREAGACISCRRPDDGSDTFTPLEDTRLRYSANRFRGTASSFTCHTSVELKIVPLIPASRPHVLSFPWQCDGALGQWDNIFWDSSTFASPAARIISVVNTSPIPVRVLLQRQETVDGAVIERTYLAESVGPGMPLPKEFSGPANGLWSISPAPPDHFGRHSCPGTDDSVSTPPVSGRNPPTLTLSAELGCDAP